MALNSDPNRAVDSPIKVTLLFDDQHIEVLEPTPVNPNEYVLEFHSGNWDQLQSIRIKAVDDKIDNAGDMRESEITHSMGGYLDESPIVNVIIHDDDERGVSFDSETVTIRRHTTDSYSLWACHAAAG